MVETLNKFGVPVDGVRAGMLMPKLTNRFRVRLTNFGPLNSAQSVDLTRQVMTVAKPNITQPEVAVHSYNSIAYFAGKHEWQAIEFQVRDDITNAVTRLVYHQVQKQMNHFEQTSPIAGSNYKFGMTTEVLDGGNDAVLERWELEGCFLTTVSTEQLNYESANAQTITMTVRYDNATLQDGLMTDVPELLTGLTRV